MWVFTYKFNSENILDKYKARLVVRGDLQRYSQHEDNYAATLAARIFRALMAIAAYFDLDYSINCDNLQTIRLMLKETPRLVTKLKHIDIHQHWLRQEIATGGLNIQWISTDSMPADGFTKALPRQKHEAFVRQLGLVDIVSMVG